MSSEIEICNSALQRLGAGRIISLSGNNKESRECAVAYPVARDSLLRSHTWGFSKARKQLAADSVAPVFGPANQYTLPVDALRVILPIDSDLDWIIEGRKILTDWPAPLDVRYVKAITDPNTMDPLFREAVAADMAYKMCEALTGSNTKRTTQLRDFGLAIAEARRVGALETLSVEAEESAWITVRD